MSLNAFNCSKLLKFSYLLRFLVNTVNGRYHYIIFIGGNIGQEEYICGL